MLAPHFPRLLVLALHGQSQGLQSVAVVKLVHRPHQPRALRAVGYRVEQVGLQWTYRNNVAYYDPRLLIHYAFPEDAREDAKRRVGYLHGVGRGSQ